MSTHKLETQLLCARVAEFMFQECAGVNFWVTAPNQSGKWLNASYPENYSPRDHRQAYAQKMCAHLNKHAHYGGAWLVGWAINAKKLIYIWKDQDGDIQLTGDCERSWFEIGDWHPDEMLALAHGLYAQWCEHMDALDLKKGQTVSLAKANPNPKTQVQNNFKH